MRAVLLFFMLFGALPAQADRAEIAIDHFYEHIKDSLHSNKPDLRDQLWWALHAKYSNFSNPEKLDAIVKILDEFIGPELEQQKQRKKTLTDNLKFIVSESPRDQMELSHLLRFMYYKKKMKMKIKGEITLQQKFTIEDVDKKSAYALFELWDQMETLSWRFVFNNVKFRYPLFYQEYLYATQPEFPSVAQVRDLFLKDPQIAKYKNGRYLNKPRIYMFCRKDRRFPCMKLIRDTKGKTHKVESKVWHQPSLGYSRKKLPSYKFNGNTPAGVWRIDGVMPEANKKITFGKNRRLIIQFVESSDSERDHKYLLPRSSHSHNWWRPAVVARDIGRGLFRIHGTGLRSNLSKPYFPFVPTIGCVAQRENKYNETRYNDQRHLLDDLMGIMSLEEKFENEMRIRGLLYVIDIDDKQEGVTLKDLQEIGLI